VLAAMPMFHKAVLAVLVGFGVLCMLAFDSQKVLVRVDNQVLRLPCAVRCKGTGIDHKLELLRLVTMLFSSFQHQARRLEHETKDWLSHLS
jgi:hypothetical protein